MAEYSFDDYLQSARLQPLAGYILTPQQEIRSRAVDSATALTGDALRLGLIRMVEPGNVAAGIGDLVADVARSLAAWIEHGDLPESGHG